MKEQTTSILLVVEDNDFFESVREKVSSDDCTIYFATNVAEARKLLRNKKHNFNGIFINPKVSDDKGVTLFKGYFASRPTTQTPL